MEHGSSGQRRRIDVIDEQTASIYRSKTPAERLDIAFGMWRFAQELVGSAVRSQHPEWDEPQVRHETARRMSHGALPAAPPGDRRAGAA